MTRCVASALFILLAVVPIASADVGECLLEVTACNADGTCIGYCALYESSFTGYTSGGVQYYQLINDVNVMFGQEVVGTLHAYDPDTGLPATNLEYHNDPEVHLNFALTAGTTDTIFQLTSSHVMFDTIYNPFGKAEVGVNVTDRNHNGATLSSVAPLTGTSESYINGLPPAPYGSGTGSLWRDILAGPVIAPMNGTQSQSDTTGANPIAIGTPVSSMSSQLNFRLSARDLASGSSTFVITPEPAGLLVLLCGLALRRR
jgi:hypothetical protein